MCFNGIKETFTKFGVDPISRKLGIEPEGLSGKIASIIPDLKPKVDAPAVVTAAESSAESVDAAAKAKASADLLNTKRRRRAASLLATGGQGDNTQPLTATPAASAGKQTLGA